jgi:electron transfer flavoprotein alpha subunit
VSGIALEGDEIRPTIQLSPEQIAELEAEKAALRGSALAGRKSDAGRIAGEGTALDPEPNVISIRSRLAAQRVAAGEEPVSNQHVREQIEQVFTGRVQDRKLNVDPAKLAQLVAAAQATQAESELADELAETAGAAARIAREALDAYLSESGLA